MAVACAVAYGCTLESGYLVIAVIATAGLCCLAYGLTNDLGYLLMGGLMTGITVIAAVCAMPGPDD